MKPGAPKAGYLLSQRRNRKRLLFGHGRSFEALVGINHLSLRETNLPARSNQEMPTRSREDTRSISRNARGVDSAPAIR